MPQCCQFFYTVRICLATPCAVLTLGTFLGTGRCYIYCILIRIVMSQRFNYITCIGVTANGTGYAFIAFFCTSGIFRCRRFAFAVNSRDLF